ncbi:MAG: hypothetical protein FVQ77_15580 [Cytophagales bacterium]|nr:hypothetical protein [Cytophagales bacterium]
MKNYVTISILLLLCVVSCTKYERVNPLDPYKETPEKESEPDIIVEFIEIKEHSTTSPYERLFYLYPTIKNIGGATKDVNGYITENDTLIDFITNNVICSGLFTDDTEIRKDQTKKFYYGFEFSLSIYPVNPQMPYSFDIILTLTDYKGSTWTQAEKITID